MVVNQVDVFSAISLRSYSFGHISCAFLFVEIVPRSYVIISLSAAKLFKRVRNATAEHVSPKAGRAKYDNQS
jgi:hypothetical protein